MRSFRGMGIGLFLLLSLQALAASEIPPVLRDWQGWARDRLEYRQCPLQAARKGNAVEDYLCAWPGELTLDANADGARFELGWQLYAAGWVSLPGDDEHWPEAVAVDGQPAPVVEHADQPALYLEAGRYRIVGRFSWNRRPQSLALPAAIALVRLSVDGQPIAPVQRDYDALVLGRGAAEAPEADAVDLRVFRRLGDGLPAELETQLQLAVAGEPRELLLGPVLPAGYVAIALEADVDWPIRLDPDGRLRIQAQPDYAEITLRARATAPLSELQMPVIEAPWPVQEIVSYQPDPALRISAARGAIQVDPQQAGVPDAWHGLASFALKAGESLQIEQRSRGLGTEQANRLQLLRQAWLDHNAAGWTFRDQLSGSMLREWRLDVRPPLRLESARSAVADEYLLVTAHAEGSTGVEWRTPRVDLDAVTRLEQDVREWPVSGWNSSFDQVDIALNLPFAYRLIAAPGADAAYGSWVDSWTLLDLFIAAILVLFSGRLLGLAGAALAAAYLLLSHAEAGAPLWTLAAVLALGLILRPLPAGRLRSSLNGLRWLSFGLLLLLTLPFAADQLRLALHPQLEAEPASALLDFEPPMARKQVAYEAAPPPPAAPPVPMSAPSPMADSAEESQYLDRIEVTGSRIRQSDLMESYSSTSVVQAGRALPGWDGGRVYRLRWSGPILAEQSVSLWISPAWLTRSLRVLMVLALGLLLWQILGRPRPRAASTALSSLMLCALLPASPAHANEALPDAALLQALAERLTRPADCVPDCVALDQASLQIEGSGLQARLTVHALGHTTLALPYDPQGLDLLTLRLDGAPLDALRRVEEAPTIALERGVHVLQLDYALLDDRVQLAFPALPKRVRVQATGWQVSGLQDGRLLTETLRLTRVRTSDGKDATTPVQAFPPFVRVERHLQLSLDWHLINFVKRIAPAEGGFNLSLPLIAGERVLSAGMKVRDGRIEVPMPDGEQDARWESMFEKTEVLEFEAPALDDHGETWTIVASPMWSVRFSGLPESVADAEADADDWHRFRFDPLPGERLRIEIRRAEAVAGETQVIERVVQESTIGRRATDHQLNFTLRATQGGERPIQLPASVELLSVQRDDQALGLRLEQGQLSLPVQPDQQQYRIRYREAGEIGLQRATPAVDFGLAAANLTLQVSLPEDRWVFWASGPAQGPAVLIWGELLVLLGLALGLSRLRWTPLSLADWLLLGLGFALFSWAAFAVVAGWLLALGWRQRQGGKIENRFLFALLQVSLVGLTLAAAAALIGAIPYGLLGQPDLHIAGNGSHAHELRWFVDQSGGELPLATVFSLPLWLYRLLMLGWALWLAMRVLGWLRFAASALVEGGGWRRLRRPRPLASEPQPAPAAAEPRAGVE